MAEISLTRILQIYLSSNPESGAVSGIPWLTLSVDEPKTILFLSFVEQKRIAGRIEGILEAVE